MSNKSIEPKNPAKSPPFPPQLPSQTSIGIEIHSFEHDLGCAGRRKAALIVLAQNPQKPGEPLSGHQLAGETARSSAETAQNHFLPSNPSTSAAPRPQQPTWMRHPCLPCRHAAVPAAIWPGWPGSGWPGSGWPGWWHKLVCSCACICTPSRPHCERRASHPSRHRRAPANPKASQGRQTPTLLCC